MPEPSHEEMLHEKHRQYLLDRGSDYELQEEVRDILLCDVHRWLEEMRAEKSEGR